MKRFYKNVTVDETPEGFRFLLDGKPVRTPARQPLLLPTYALADAVAQEWREQEDEMRPAAMPLTRLVNTVLDGVRATREQVIAAILRFGENDLLSYRAESPVELVTRQRQWNDYLDWVSRSPWRPAGGHHRRASMSSSRRRHWRHCTGPLQTATISSWRPCMSWPR